MARRERHRAQRTPQALRKPRDRMARVQVSDEEWAAYRTGLGTTPVSVALGELVRREVGREARRGAIDRAGVRLALTDARELADELEGLIGRLEYAARSARAAAEHRSATYPTSAGRTGSSADPWRSSLSCFAQFASTAPDRSPGGRAVPGHSTDDPQLDRQRRPARGSRRPRLPRTSRGRQLTARARERRERLACDAPRRVDPNDDHTPSTRS